MKLHKQSLLIFFISIAVAILNILIVIIGATKTPPGSLYLAVGHYFTDYFEYVQQVAQGIRGHWLVDNPYTINDSTKTFIGWGQYLIYGKIANLFHWSPFFTYWLVVFTFALILARLLFQLIKQLLPKEKFNVLLTTWLISLFAAPLVKIISENNQLKISSYNFWYEPLSFFHRFGGVPHQLLTTILVAVLLIAIGRLIDNLNHCGWRQLLVLDMLICLMLVFLLTFAPFQVINLISGLVIVGWYYLNRYLLANSKKGIVRLCVFIGLVIFVIVPTAIIIQSSHQAGDLFKRAIVWETAQFSYPPVWELLATIGPLFIFIPFGIKVFFKEKSPIRLLFFGYVGFSYFYLYTPLAIYLGSHNYRFINPIIFGLFAVLGLLGIRTVCRWLTKKSWLVSAIIIGLLSYYLVVTTIIYRSFSGVDRLSYLPKPLVTGIRLLDKQADDRAVLTAPPLSLGLIVPVLVDRKVYLGRTIFTPDYENKLKVVDQFYRGQMPIDQAKKLIVDNDIGYVILARQEVVEGNYQSEISEIYPFLKKFYENSEVSIYKVIWAIPPISP